MSAFIRQVLVIGLHQLRREVLRGAPLVLTVIPVIIIYVLGMSMQALFTGGYIPSKPFRVALAANGDHGSGLIEVLSTDPRFFSVTVAEDATGARQAVRARESDAALIVPDAYPDEPLTIVAPPRSVVRDVLAGFIEEGFSPDVSIGSSGSGRRSDGAGSAAASPAEETSPWAAVDAFGYFGVGLTVMFAMYVGHTMMIACAGDRASGVYARLRAIGVSRQAYLWSGFASAVVIGAIFIAVMRLATRLLYGIDWGDPLAWGVLTLAGAAGIAALSFVILAVSPANPKGVDAAGSALYTVLAFLGGSTVPLNVMPGWYTEIFAWLPNRVMLDGYFLVAGGAGLDALSGSLVALGAGAALLLAVGWVVLGLRGKGEM